MPRLDQRLGLTRYEADESYKRALDAYRKGDFDTAIDGMNEAIESLPSHAEYYAARGFFYLEDGEDARAKADFELAIKHWRYEMLAHYGLGTIAYKKAQKSKDPTDWEAALMHFTDAYRIDPNRAETLYYLALVYYFKSDYANAVKYMMVAQTAFDQVGDKRRSNADRWMREFQRMVERTQTMLGGAKPQLPSS
jgi:tetratricopeptide (TPR) repeat protein